MNPSPQELKEMVEEIDVDGSGSIDFDEFRLMMVKQLEAEQEDKIPERPEKELADAFRLFDTKLDSKIDWDELKAALEVAGETVEDWEVDELMRDGDKNNDWVIDYDEFINDEVCSSFSIRALSGINLLSSVGVILKSSPGFWFGPVETGSKSDSKSRNIQLFVQYKYYMLFIQIS